MSHDSATQVMEIILSMLDEVGANDPDSFQKLIDKFEEVGKMIADPDNDLIKENLGLIIEIMMLDSDDPEKDIEKLKENSRKLQEFITQDNGVSGANPEDKPVADEQPKKRKKLRLPDWVDEAIYRDFLSSQRLVLEEIESAILSLDDGDDEPLAILRRRIHTMKGESGMMGVEELMEVCHAIEDFLDSTEPGQQRIDMLLRTTDWIAQAVASYAEYYYPETTGAQIVEMLRKGVSEEEEQDLSVEEPDEDYPEMPEEPAPESLQMDEGESSSEDDDLPDEVEADSESDSGEIFEESEPEHEDRDEEVIAMIADFLAEGEEGLSDADQILLDVEHDEANSEMINGLFRVFHSLKGVAGFLELKEITSLAHITETALNKVRQGKYELEGVLLDLVFDATSMMRKMLETVRQAVEKSLSIPSTPGVQELVANIETFMEGGPLPQTELPKAEAKEKLGEILQKEPISTPKEKIDEALKTQEESGKKLGEVLVENKTLEPKQVGQALRSQRMAQDAQPTTPAKLKETVKVDLQRVDTLVELVGELVVVESMIAHAPEIVENSSIRVRNYLNQLSKISRDIQNLGMGMRMVPVRGVFQKMARMVRDLSRKSGKKISLIQSGEGTEIDRSMVEKIHDPLVHMIRNSVDHGIEPPEERIEKGKPRHGTVLLAAYHEGGHLVIEIEDDGRGLNREAILDKARTKGLIRENEILSDHEVFNLIFHPGFSTAAKVTEISGRGVGMDVVKRNIDSMRGRITISSRPDEGSTFKIILPLTLAIIDGMLVACGKERYIIPTLSIVESIKPTKKMISDFAQKGEAVNVRGQIIPMIRMYDLFDISSPKTDPTKALVVVIETAGRKIGLLVDEVLSLQQVVIKNISNDLDMDSKWISGGAILSDGKVGLILNVDEIGNMFKDLRSYSTDGGGSGMARAQ